MLYRYVVITLFMGLFSSCAQKVYQKEDYTFYDKTFKLDASSGLRTDGVYVLDRIWTDENGGITKQPKEHRFYKFYEGGQCNLTLDPSGEIKTKEEYIAAVSKDFVIKKSTLFEGYYKLKDDRIVIQSVVVPRKQFEYKYGYVDHDSLIIVKATTEGSGKFDDSYFTAYYKEYYVFVPLAVKNVAQPQW